MNRLRQAAALCAQGTEDEEGVLRLLLGAWREQRAPRLADLIDGICSLVTKARGPIGKKGMSKVALDAEWLRIAKHHDPCDLGRLLAAEWPRNWEKNALPRTNELLAWPEDDPRIAMALARLCSTPPWDTPQSHKLFKPLLARIGELRDVRVKELLVAEFPQGTRPFRYRRDVWVDHEKPVALLLRAQPTPAIDDPEELGAIAQIEAYVAAARGKKQRVATELRENEERHIAAILAAHDDDAPRQVYADFLTERGDPRGEYMTLSLTPLSERTAAMRQRMSDLEKTEMKRLAGALDTMLEPRRRIFERGFLVGGEIRESLLLSEYAQVFRHPAWVFFRTLSIPGGGGQALVDALRGSAMRSLRAIHDLEDTVLFSLCHDRAESKTDEPSFPPIDEASASMSGFQDDWIGSHTSWLTNDLHLKKLSLALPPRDGVPPPNLDWLFSSDLLKGRLTALTLVDASERLGHWVAAVLRAGPLSQFTTFTLVDMAIREQRFVRSKQRSRYLYPEGLRFVLDWPSRVLSIERCADNAPRNFFGQIVSAVTSLKGCSAFVKLGDVKLPGGAELDARQWRELDKLGLRRSAKA